MDAAGRLFTRQGLQQAYLRREGNGFPERRMYNINGHERWLFDMDEVLDWYFSFAAAAVKLSLLAGKTYTPAEVYRLWQCRDLTRWPERVQGEFLEFDERQIEDWWKRERADAA